jgi:hypothetical protein
MLVKSVLTIIVRLRREIFNTNMISLTNPTRKGMMSRIRTALSLSMMDTSSKKVSSKIVTRMISSKKSLRLSRKEKRR